jgi:hypothetical protein
MSLYETGDTRLRPIVSAGVVPWPAPSLERCEMYSGRYSCNQLDLTKFYGANEAQMPQSVAN